MASKNERLEIRIDPVYTYTYKIQQYVYKYIDKQVGNVYIYTNKLLNRYGFMGSMVKGAAKRQLIEKINMKASMWSNNNWTPYGGWVFNIRKALGMSGGDLGARVGLKRSRISQIEKAEMSGSVTLKTMERIAEGLGCQFVYAIIPTTSYLEDVVNDQARKKAKEVVGRAAVHMLLEDQLVSAEKTLEQIQTLSREMAEKRPKGFWRP